LEEIELDIVLLDGLALNQDLDWTALKKLGECTLYDRTPAADETEILRRIGDATVVLTHKTPLTALIIQQAPQLKYIGIMGTGYDIVDVTAARAAGVTVTNIPTYGTEAVAQFTFALLLEITSQVGLHNELVHAGRWAKGPDFTFWAKPLIELHGKVMGLVGYGHIAQRVAEIAHAFGMAVIFYNHRPKTDLPEWVQQVDFDTLLHRTDVIGLHVLQKPETIGLIDAAAIQKVNYPHLRPQSLKWELATHAQ
jgi:glycerate dehydrogenase